MAAAARSDDDGLDDRPSDLGAARSRRVRRALRQLEVEEQREAAGEARWALARLVKTCSIACQAMGLLGFSVLAGTGAVAAGVALFIVVGLVLVLGPGYIRRAGLDA